MTLGNLAMQLDGELIGSDQEFSRLSTDTRTLQKGDLYLALVGERFDGHDFLSQASAAGACAAVVKRVVDSPLTQFRVADTHQALGRIAGLNRSRSDATVVALTGSQGKTTVKEMLAAILSVKGATLKTAANLNNTIGVPLTLLQLEAEHEYAVIEMGANGAGEIAFSADITRPDIALITNASPAHIEGFGSLQGIVEAKGEIIDAVSATGVVLLNADDAAFSQWQQRAGDRRLIRFSYGNPVADYYSEQVKLDANGCAGFVLHTPQGKCQVSQKLLGQHNVMNAIIAAAAAMEAGADLHQVKTGLASLEPLAGRMMPLRGYRQARLIDDSYNASPASFKAAIDVLAAADGLRYLICGDMKELGEEAMAAHESVGAYAAAAGLDGLWAVGELGCYTVKGAGAIGKLFPSVARLVAACREQAGDTAIFLVKGSRGAHMEDVVNQLKISEDS